MTRTYRVVPEVQFRLLAVETGEPDEDCGAYSLGAALRLAREFKAADEKRALEELAGDFGPLGKC